MDRLVGIIRTENALIARQVRQSIALDFTDCAAIEQAVLDGLTENYEFIDAPLTLSTPRLSPLQASLLEDWEALGNAAAPDSDRVRRVLAETVLGQPIQRTLPLLKAQTQNAPMKPTAAHPRAYLGTKYKPPTPKSAAPQDWRPSLCDPRTLGSLATDAAMEAAAEARLPDSFRVSLYPLVREQSDAEIAEMLALYWALSLGTNPSRLAAGTCLFSLQCSRNSRDWCRFVISQPQDQWTVLLHLLIESGAYAVEFQSLSSSFVEMLTEVLLGKDEIYRAYWLMHGLTAQIDSEYLLTGYRLADAYSKSYAFHSVQSSDYFPVLTVLRWGEYCRDADDFYTETLLAFWEQCGLRPGLGECLERLDWTQLTPDAASRCLKLLRCSWDNWGDLPEAEANAKWTAALPFVDTMLALVRDVPSEYQDKCAWHLIEYLWQWDTPAELKANLPSALILTRRLCSVPFAEKNDSTEAATDFLTHLPALLRERFLQAPNVSFRRLEQACRRENDTWLISRGTWGLTGHQAEFSVRCFESEPERLFHAAKLLGTLPKPMRDTIARAFTLLPGEALRTSLDRLEQEAMQALAQGFSLEIREHIEKHALQMQQVIGDNRRALRKFLAAHWEGRTDYRQTHSLTRQWLAKHPKLNLETWQNGVVSHAESEVLGTVTLTIEQNPLEALKLGTYVGSCLGLGGSFAYSAAAVVLDINKQVVYARDERGSVVGRQLVAVSEDDQVVCYEVYPLSAQKDLSAAFAEFDRQFALALNLPIYNRNNTEDYKIVCILSEDWWDDRAWDLTVDTEE
ncbi:MAG: hypothetical protein ACRYFS_06315 [Janthinobacterium lividum]